MDLKDISPTSSKSYTSIYNSIEQDTSPLGWVPIVTRSKSYLNMTIMMEKHNIRSVLIILLPNFFLYSSSTKIAMINNLWFIRQSWSCSSAWTSERYQPHNSESIFVCLNLFSLNYCAYLIQWFSCALPNIWDWQSLLYLLYILMTWSTLVHINYLILTHPHNNKIRNIMFINVFSFI